MVNEILVKKGKDLHLLGKIIRSFVRQSFTSGKVGALNQVFESPLAQSFLIYH